jgi:hypothetical protein
MQHEVEADRLVGFEENPDISTTGKGSFSAKIDRRARTISFRLSYSRLEGAVQQAHIHVRAARDERVLTVGLDSGRLGRALASVCVSTGPTSATHDRCVGADHSLPTIGRRRPRGYGSILSKA